MRKPTHIVEISSGHAEARAWAHPNTKKIAPKISRNFVVSRNFASRHRNRKSQLSGPPSNDEVVRARFCCLRFLRIGGVSQRLLRARHLLVARSVHVLSQLAGWFRVLHLFFFAFRPTHQPFVFTGRFVVWDATSADRARIARCARALSVTRTSTPPRATWMGQRAPCRVHQAR